MKIDKKQKRHFLNILFLSFCSNFRNIEVLFTVILAKTFLIPSFIIPTITATIHGLILNIIVTFVISFSKACSTDAGTFTLHTVVTFKCTIIFTIVHQFGANWAQRKALNIVRPISKQIKINFKITYEIFYELRKPF